MRSLTFSLIASTTGVGMSSQREWKDFFLANGMGLLCHAVNQGLTASCGRTNTRLRSASLRGHEKEWTKRWPMTVGVV